MRTLKTMQDAAPDMYAALEMASKLLDLLTGPDDAIARAASNQINAALKKARGE